MTGDLEQFIRGVYGEPTLRLPNIIAVQTGPKWGEVRYVMDDNTFVVLSRKEIEHFCRFAGEERDLVRRRWIEQHGGRAKLPL